MVCVVMKMICLSVPEKRGHFAPASLAGSESNNSVECGALFPDPESSQKLILPVLE
jgi:hypothetical protein